MIRTICILGLVFSSGCLRTSTRLRERLPDNVAIYEAILMFQIAGMAEEEKRTTRIFVGTEGGDLPKAFYEKFSGTSTGSTSV